MINLEPILKKKAELKKALSSTKFTSTVEVQRVFDEIWKESNAIIKDQLKYGNKAEKSLSKFLPSLTSFTPSIVEMIEYEVSVPIFIQELFKRRNKSIPNFIQELFKCCNKSISAVSTEPLMNFFENYFSSLSNYINTMPDDENNISESDSSEMDSFAASMQLIIADIYSFRNLERMKPANVETTISDLVDAMEHHGYLIIDYDGNNDDKFSIMHADVQKAIMKSPSIMKHATNEIIKKGRLITPMNK